jgi:hypothetical protein
MILHQDMEAAVTEDDAIGFNARLESIVFEYP